MSNFSRAARAVIAVSLLTGGSAALPLGGCAAKQIGDGPAYPEQTRQARVLDIHVVRDETEISFTNTSGQDLPAGRLWINHWYSREFAGLAIGQSVTMSLFEFKDRYGDAFRAGGFFATDKPDRVVQVQLEAGEEIIGLIAIRWSRD